MHKFLHREELNPKFHLRSHSKKIYDQYKKDHQVCDYADMIEEFTDKAVEPDIKALIVDEAQDSNVPQRKALDKMATNTEEYYFVGDADQTLSLIHI